MKKVKQYSVERGFISKLIESKDFKSLKDQQIQPFFLTGDNRRIYSGQIEIGNNLSTAKVVSVRKIPELF